MGQWKGFLYSIKLFNIQYTVEQLSAEIITDNDNDMIMTIIVPLSIDNISIKIFVSPTNNIKILDKSKNRSAITNTNK